MTSDSSERKLTHFPTPQPGAPWDHLPNKLILLDESSSQGLLLTHMVLCLITGCVELEAVESF